jgi:hypothetical protein
MKIVRARSEMWISPTRMLRADELLPADDPLVVAHPEWFNDDLEPLFTRSGPPAVKQRTTATQPMVKAR